MNAIRRRRAQADSGFTLLEVVVAMGILATGLLALAAMQLHAMRGGKTGRHTTAAAALAYTQLENFQRMTFTDPQLAQTAGWVPVGGVPLTTVVQQNPVNVVEQTYNLQWRITDLNAAPLTLKSIDVRITWAEPNRPNRDVTITTIRHDDPATPL